MDRYSRGMPLTANQKNPLYYNGEFPDIQGLDLTEIQALRRQADEQVKKYKADLEKQESDKKSAKEREIQQRIKDLENQLKEQGNQARGKVEGFSPNNPIS